MKVGLVQQKNTADIPANIQKLQDNIRKAAAMGAELVVLQELHNGLYFCQTENTEIFNQAEPIPGPSTETFGKLAKTGKRIRNSFGFVVVRTSCSGFVS